MRYRIATIGAFSCMVLAVAFYWKNGLKHPSAESSKPPSPPTFSAMDGDSPAKPGDFAVAQASSAATVSDPSPPSPTSKQRFYQISYSQGTCSLARTDDIPGDFAGERVQPWRPGMWACRLLDKEANILSERTLNAPDQSCVVLDPNVSSSAEAVPLRMTDDGPVVFQVRFPLVTGAVKMDVIRITTESRPPTANGYGGELVSSILLHN